MSMHINLIYHSILDQVQLNLFNIQYYLARRQTGCFSFACFIPVMRLDVISGRISIFSMRIRISPGNERIIIVSEDGSVRRIRKPSRKPRNTPAIVNVRSRLLRRESRKTEQN